MTFYAFGLNHQHASVRLRERFALDEAGLRRFYASLRLGEGAELILLSTCNRTEAYLYGTAADVGRLKAALAVRAGQPWPEAEAFEVQDEEAVRHVLQVTCGLKSLVLGDAQIFAQVKEAYRLAADEGRVGTAMHRLMHTAFRAAKQVINDTKLTTGAASVPRVAVAAARAHVAQYGGDGLAGCRVLLVGAGQMGQLSLEALREDDLAAVTVTNRSVERARTLGARFGAEVVAWADRHAAVADADLVIVATAADAPVLQAEALPAPRPGRPTLLIDISVPRNVDPAADARPGYAVLDLDALNRWLVETEVARRAAVPAAEQICEAMLAEFVAWMFHQQAMQPAIDAIRETFERIREQEVTRHHHRFSEVDRAELDVITRSILQKLLAVPIVHLKSVDPGSIDFVQGIRLLHALFSRPGCEDPSAQEPEAVVPRLLEGQGDGACPFDVQLEAEAPAASGRPA